MCSSQLELLLSYVLRRLCSIQLGLTGHEFYTVCFLSIGCVEYSVCLYTAVGLKSCRQPKDILPTLSWDRSCIQSAACLLLNVINVRPRFPGVTLRSHPPPPRAPTQSSTPLSASQFGAVEAALQQPRGKLKPAAAERSSWATQTNVIWNIYNSI